MTSYSVTTWKANNQPVDDSGNYVLLKGRQAGLVGFLLNAVGLSPTFAISISGECINISTESLSVIARRAIPLENCCSTSFGYKRPWPTAIILGLLLAGAFGLLGWAIFGGETGRTLGVLLGVALAVVYFILNKTLYLSFMEMSGRDNPIAFSGSFIEGIVLNEKSASYVIVLCQALIDARVAARMIATPVGN